MKDTELLWKMAHQATQFAKRCHEGQVGKDGNAYIMHPLHVSKQFDDPVLRAIAVLHDVVEDTEATMDDIRAHFPARVADAVECLTHREGEPYPEYIARIALNPDASKVKIEDLRHNLDLSRLEVVTHKDVERCHRYVDAILLLTLVNQ